MNKSAAGDMKEDCMSPAKFEKGSLQWVGWMAVASGLALAGCRQAAADPRATVVEDKPIKVATAAVAARTAPRFLALTGTLVPNQKADVAADVSGKVWQTFVERGSYVTKGFALASVDARSAAISRSEAGAQARALEVQSAQATSDCARIEQLFRDGSVSKAEHDRQLSQCESTEWSKKAADARAQMAGKTLGDSTIRAPFAGIVAERLVTAGEYVRPDTRVITLVDIDKMRLELTVQESAISSIQVGQSVNFRVASFGNTDFTAKIQYVGPALRRSSRDLLVEAVFDNADRKLLPGMFATARVELGTYQATVVPQTAIREADTTKHIFVVKDKHIEERIVETGEQLGDMVAVSKGVALGELVVAKVNAEVKDGARVE
jgi:membrane fusion protein (multidrug efflux system)